MRVATLIAVIVMFFVAQVHHPIGDTIGRFAALFLAFVFFIIFPIQAVQSMSRQPGNSYKKVLLRIGLFFAVCFALTATVFALAYFLHAPGVNPR